MDSILDFIENDIAGKEKIAKVQETPSKEIPCAGSVAINQSDRGSIEPPVYH